MANIPNTYTEIVDSNLSQDVDRKNFKTSIDILKKSLIDQCLLMHNEVIKKKEVIHHLFWRVQKKSRSEREQPYIGTGRPIGLKLPGKGE